MEPSSSPQTFIKYLVETKKKANSFLLLERFPFFSHAMSSVFVRIIFLLRNCIRKITKLVFMVLVIGMQYEKHRKVTNLNGNKYIILP